MIWYSIGIIISGIAGFLLARYIGKNKLDSEHLVCPLGQSCDQVINGRFSQFLGIPVEKMGQLYYLAIIAFYTASLFGNFSEMVMGIGLLVTGISFAFSMYLTLAQLLVLKKWCTLCLGSAAISFMILVLAFLGYDASFINFIYSFHDLLKGIYIFAILVGVLTTTLHTSTFLKFLRDFKISQEENRRLRMFSNTAWVAIIMTLLSGIALVLNDMYNEIVGGERFVVLAVVLGILVVYEVVVNMVVGPRLIDLHFAEGEEMDDHEHDYQRKLAFGFSAMGVISWYMLLLFSTISFYPYSSTALILLYFIVLIIFVALALWAERIIAKQAKITQ